VIASRDIVLPACSVAHNRVLRTVHGLPRPGWIPSWSNLPKDKTCPGQNLWNGICVILDPLHRSALRLVHFGFRLDIIRNPDHADDVRACHCIAKTLKKTMLTLCSYDFVPCAVETLGSETLTFIKQLWNAYRRTRGQSWYCTVIVDSNSALQCNTFY